jgi:prepilin-type N-terminal cleavage/methylation domain-containing protein
MLAKSSDIHVDNLGRAASPRGPEGAPDYPPFERSQTARRATGLGGNPNRRAGYYPAPRLASRGVTLMEMLVVLAIIGLLAGISFPSLSAGIDSVRMVSATDSVASFLNAAVNRAERRQEPIELLISAKDNALKLYSNEPDFTRELKMPEGVRIEAVLPKETDEEDAPTRLILLPGASVPGIGIQIVNRRGSRRIVRLDPMTGFPHVESVIPQ